MKILVTGANSYLGQGVAKQLLDDGQEVIAADISTQYTQYIDTREKISKIATAEKEEKTFPFAKG